MANTLTVSNPRRLLNGSQAVMDVESRLVDGSATFVAGQWCFAKNDGLVYTCASDADAGTGGIHYVANETVSAAIGADTTRKRFSRITQDDVFEMFELDGTVAESDTLGSYGIDVTSNVVTYDLGDTTNPAVVLQKPTWTVEEFKNDSTDIKAKAFAKVLPAVLEAAIV